MKLKKYHRLLPGKFNTCQTESCAIVSTSLDCHLWKTKLIKISPKNDGHLWETELAKISPENDRLKSIFRQEQFTQVVSSIFAK